MRCTTSLIASSEPSVSVSPPDMAPARAMMLGRSRISASRRRSWSSVKSSMGLPDMVKMAARSVGLSPAMCRNAASRTRGRSSGARWTSSNRYATNRSGTTTALPFSSSEEGGLPGVALASSEGLLPNFSTEKRVISCGLPLSKSWKLALVRLPTATPWLSRTTTGTITRLTCDLKAAVSSRVFISVALGLAGACCGGNGGPGGGTVCACAISDLDHHQVDMRLEGCRLFARVHLGSVGIGWSLLWGQWRPRRWNGLRLRHCQQQASHNRQRFHDISRLPLFGARRLAHATTDKK